MKHFSHLDSTVSTDVGRKRKNNEDASLLLPEQGVFCVADGMGGGDDGEFASAAFVEQVQALFAPYRERLRPLDIAAKLHLVRLAANEACRQVRRRMRERGTSGTGSTAVVLLFDAADPSHAAVLHAGDSRVYRSRGGRLAQVTNDHSVGSIVGIKNEDDLPALFRGVVTRGIGLDEAVELELTEVDVAEGDLFLICSDGLNRMVSDREIRGRLRSMRGQLLNHVALSLIDDALEAGGKDNVTVLLVRVGPLPAPEAVENPLFETTTRGVEAGGGTAPTTVTDASPTPAPPSDGSAADGSTDHGLPDDQACIEGAPAGGQTPTDPEGAAGNAFDGAREHRKACGWRDRLENLWAVAERQAGRLERRWKALDRDVRLRWLVAAVAGAVLLLVAVRWVAMGRDSERGAEEQVADVPAGKVLIDRGAEGTSVLWKVDLATGGMTEILGAALQLAPGDYVFRWDRPGFERQRHAIRVEAGKEIMLRAAPWIPVASRPGTGARTAKE